MSAITATTVLRLGYRPRFVGVVNKIHISAALASDMRWRVRHGLARNPNSCGPLTDYPDYTFKDGRPTPLGTRQFNRLQKQREYAERIVRLVGEVDYAVERHARLQREEEERREQVLATKLKPKGNLQHDGQSSHIKSDPNSTES